MHKDSDPTPANGTPRPHPVSWQATMPADTPMPDTRKAADILATVSSIMEDWEDTGDSDTAHVRLRNLLILAEVWQTVDTLREVRPASRWTFRVID